MRSKSTMKAAKNSRGEGRTNIVLGNTARETALQAAGGLLGLPLEIRLYICSYITLAPESPDSLANRGILGACRQLQQDMFEEHGPAKDLSAYITAPERPWAESPCTHSAVALGPPRPLSGFICNVTLHLPPRFLSLRRQFRRCGQSQFGLHVRPECSCEGDLGDTLEHLYSLYLDRLQVLFGDHLSHHEYDPSQRGDGSSNHRRTVATADEQDNEDIKDDKDDTKNRRFTVKSLDPRLFDEYVDEGKVNCRTVIFTVQELANAKGGRHKSTTLDMSDEKTGISYTMTIVQDDEEIQVEREFVSDTRFRRGALHARAG